MYWNFPVGLKRRNFETDLLLNLSPLHIVLSKKLASEKDISAVNLTVGWF